MRPFRIWCVLVCAIFLNHWAFAQAATPAQLSGTVTSAGIQGLNKVSISLTSAATHQVYKTSSDANGGYTFSNVPPGKYTLTAELAGFETYLREIELGEQPATLNIALASTAEQSFKYVPHSSVGKTMWNETQELPLNGRRTADLAWLTPAATDSHTDLDSTFTEPATTRISFEGQRDRSNLVLVDGADNISTATGLERAMPSQEAIEQIEVFSNSYDAEYGRALGGVLLTTTRSGTNQFHGALYDYYQSNGADADSPLALPGFNVYHDKQFGGAIGGPIQPDKTFFFANIEGQRAAQSPTYPALLIGNLSTLNSALSSFGL